MRPNVFDHEMQLAAQARERLASGRIDSEAYSQLLDAFEKLLRQSEKIVRTGDSTQNKLLRAQKMLHRAIQRYKAAADEKSELLSIVTHDLKNKAGPIRELSRWVIEEVQGTASPRALEMLRHIHEAAEKMSQSVNHTLKRESNRSSEIVPVFEWTDLVRLVERTVEEQQGPAMLKGITLVPQLPIRCEARVDEFLIGEVFENLINNAIKFSPPQSTVEILLHKDESGPRFEVKDHGPGLTEDDKIRMFGRFQVLSARPTGGEASTGMGLFIVKKLVELHNGSVTAESDGPGKGTRFTIQLPLQVDPAALAK